MVDIFTGTSSFKSQEQAFVDNAQPLNDPALDLGFVDSALASFEYSYKVGTREGQGSDWKKERLNQHRLFKQAGEDDLAWDLQKTSLSFGVEEPILAFYKKNDAKIKELQSKFPNAGIKNFDQMDQEIFDKRKAIIERNDQPSVGMGNVGSILGYIGGYFADPINAASTIPPLGFGLKGATIGSTLGKMAAAELAYNGALAFKDIPGEIGILEEVTGQEQDVVHAWALATGLGFVGDIIGSSAMVGLRHLRSHGTPENPVSQETVRAFNNNMKMEASSSVLDDRSALGEAIDLAAETPLGASQMEHISKYAKVRNMLATDNPSALEEQLLTARSGKDVMESANSEQLAMELITGTKNHPEHWQGQKPAQDFFDTLLEQYKVEHTDRALADIETKLNDEAFVAHFAPEEMASFKTELRDIRLDEKAHTTIEQCMYESKNLGDE